MIPDKDPAESLIQGGRVINEDKIINGKSTGIKSFPYIVSLRKQPWWLKDSHICGGAIISEWSILTAAHCVFGKSPSDIAIVAGLTRIDHNNLGSNGQAVFVTNM